MLSRQRAPSKYVAKKKMAGVVVVGADSSLTVEALYRGGKDRPDPTLTSFEKDIDFVLQPISKKSKKSFISPETNRKL